MIYGGKYPRLLPFNTVICVKAWYQSCDHSGYWYLANKSSEKTYKYFQSAIIYSTKMKSRWKKKNTKHPHDSKAWQFYVIVSFMTSVAIHSFWPIFLYSIGSVHWGFEHLLMHSSFKASAFQLESRSELWLGNFKTLILRFFRHSDVGLWYASDHCPAAELSFDETGAVR